MGIKIQGTGSFLPSHVVTNHDLSALMPTNHEWIMERTGIASRHFAKDQQNYELGVMAAKEALLNANLDPLDIDAILVATTTPDQVFPSTAVHIQRELGANNAFCFDIQAVCAGFVYGLGVARSFLLSGQAKRILLVGTEKFSPLLNFEDRSTAILFGDGAGAVVLENSSDSTDNGACYLKSNGHLAHILDCKDDIYMEGQEVFKNAVRLMCDAALTLLTQQNLTLDDVDVIIPHQANLRIIQSIAQRLKIEQDKFIITLETHANTSAASIPLALHQAVCEGAVKRGDRVLFVGLGSGLAWGAFLMTY